MGITPKVLLLDSTFLRFQDFSQQCLEVEVIAQCGTRSFGLDTGVLFT